MARCLIIGSGIVGLSTAYELKKAGFDITIFDDEKRGQASKSAGGILFPLNPWENSKNMQELCLSGHNEYNNFFKKLKDKKKNEINYSKKDLIIFGDKISLAKKWYAKNKDIKSNYYEKELYQIERNIKKNHKNFLLVKDINIINPNSIIKFYKKRLLNSGVIFKKEKVIDLLPLLGSSNNKFDYIIITAGVWSKEILCLENEINIKPIKGQLLHYKANKKILDNVLIYNDYYIIPRSDNNLVVGSTLEDVGFNEEITNEAKTYLQKAILELFSAELELKEVKQTFGFRPYSNLEQPYIRQHADNNRIIFNFGHFRYGILTAISSAKIVKNIIK